MASTYSPNLKIELIASGEQSGVWGDTTNTNLGDLIEEAIAGFATQAVTDGAATVLTIPDGASSVGRNYVIELTGTLTANRAVEVPAVDKPYTFFNNTTGGFSVTVKVSGGTGVTIANGKKAIVYANSIDVIEVANAPVTEDGTQTLTNKTIVGGSWTATSPSSISVNSTSDAFKITQTGTGNAFVVEDSSSTDATPFVIDANGNVGIGTNAPAAKLQVLESGSQDALRVTNTGTGNSFVVEDSASSDATPFVIDNDGNVVVGAASIHPVPAGDGGNRSVPFQVQGNLFTKAALSAVFYNPSAGGGGTVSLARSNTTIIGSHSVVASGDVMGSVFFSGSDGTAFVRGAQITANVDGTPGLNDMPGRIVLSTTADGASSPTERMRIDSAGQVGIGTVPTPGRSLVIAKNLTGNATAIHTFSITTVQPDVTTEARMFSTFPSTAAAAFSLPILVHYNASQGTLGAGSSVVNQYGYLAASTLTGATNNYGFYGNIAAATGRWNFYAQGTADNYFAGNVGIATTTPTQKLDINDDSIRVRTAKTPASATATGTQGQIAWDADYVYVCTATNVWKRTAITTW